MADPKDKDGAVKTGLHLVAPNISATVEDCVEIQKKGIDRLSGLSC